MSFQLQDNLGLASVPTSFGEIRLDPWELHALRQNPSDGDESFRAQMARNLSLAIGIIARIEDEMDGYYATKGKDRLWAAHCDALLYLLHEGRRYLSTLEAAVVESKKRGLLEKSQQLSKTASKLEHSLARVGSLSEPDWLTAPLP